MSISNEIAEEVKAWLIEEEIFKQQVIDDLAEWHYLVEFPPESEQVSEIILPKGRSFILIASGLVLADEHYKALHSLPYEEKKEIIHKWKLDLLFREAEFRMIPDDLSVQRIDFSIPVYFEELTKPKLFEGLREIFKCKLYIIWNLHHKFGEAMYK